MPSFGFVIKISPCISAFVSVTHCVEVNGSQVRSGRGSSTLTPPLWTGGSGSLPRSCEEQGYTLSSLPPTGRPTTHTSLMHYIGITKETKIRAQQKKQQQTTFTVSQTSLYLIHIQLISTAFHSVHRHIYFSVWFQWLFDITTQVLIKSGHCNIWNY